MEFIQRNRAWIFLAAIVMLALIVGWLVWSMVVFRVTGTSPSQSAVSTATPQVSIYFNHKLADQDIKNKVSASSEIIENVEWQEKSIHIKIIPGILDQEEDYLITLENIQDTEGKSIGRFEFAFTAEFMEFNRLSEEQQKAVLEQQERKNETTADPLLVNLPYGGLNYRLSASNESSDDGTQTLVVSAEIVLSSADVRTDRQAAIRAAKKDIGLYFKDLGLDINNYNVRYTTVEPPS